MVRPCSSCFASYQFNDIYSDLLELTLGLNRWQYGTALDYLAEQLKSAAATKTDQIYSIVPTSQDEWRILF
eukprot:COSAG02_NODE_16276_length_1097_cov_0.976954_1_plen_70_part_10